MRKILLICICFMSFCGIATAKNHIIWAKDYGITPSNSDNTPALNELFKKNKKLFEHPLEKATIKFEKGTYQFLFDEAKDRQIFISNHDQTLGKRIVFDLSNYTNVTIDGGKSTFLFQGLGIPFAVEYAKNIRLRNFSIDFVDPQITEIEILDNTSDGIFFKIHENNPLAIKKYTVNKEGYFQVAGDKWAYTPFTGIAFDKVTHHILYNTGDLSINTANCSVKDGIFHAPEWKDNRLRKGIIVALRDYYRPTPGIWLAEAENSRIENVSIHYSLGMGLIAQRCNNVSLNHFSVLPSHGRYSSTQADATHFSQCKGKIISKNGYYEGMMDDAINVHGIYLRIYKQLDSHTALCKFMHSQAWGFYWGNTGDSIRFIDSSTLGQVGKTNPITSILPQDATGIRGMHTFIITFKKPIPENADAIENTSCSPDIYFTGNTIRNNRARGALFSSFGKTICEKNLFDHTSGSAILLSGDCNGWYESGPVNHVIIKNNQFINALTSRYQFTEAIISIAPEIPAIEKQTHPYHHNILIEKNLFDTFPCPLLYAKSVDGIIFKKNKVMNNQDYPSLFKEIVPVKLEHCTRAMIQNQ